MEISEILFTLFNSKHQKLDNLVNLGLISQKDATTLLKHISNYRNIVITSHDDSKISLLNALLEYKMIPCATIFDNTDKITPANQDLLEDKDFNFINNYKDLSIIPRSTRRDRLVVAEILGSDDGYGILHALKTGRSIITTMNCTGNWKDKFANLFIGHVIEPSIQKNIINVPFVQVEIETINNKERITQIKKV